MQPELREYIPIIISYKLNMKKWVILQNQITNNRQQITDDEIIKILLMNRGITNKKDIDDFLNPKLDNITTGSVGLDEKELKKAAIRIKKAIDGKESVVVFTDYDADGITSGAIVWETLYSLGAKVMPYVPHRVKEGYGLSKTGIDAIKDKYKVNLLITVDHGVTAFEQIKYAKNLGIETIILDHHLLPKILPQFTALIHTVQMCSGGIAWIFCNFLYNYFSKDKKNKSDNLQLTNIRNLDLAAIATIADLVPLTSANRIIAKYGLEEINNTKRIGLNAMIKDAGLEKGGIDVYSVGHILAPRINAMGRMMHALDALRLICTNDKERASGLARQLSEVNRDRQEKTMEATYLALEMVKAEKQTKLIFISHPKFQEGIIGLVAGKLVEESNLPAIVVSVGEKMSKASARSISGFNIVEMIRRGEDLLEDIGGHPMAAGFTVATRHIKSLKNKLTQIANEELKNKDLAREQKIDMVIPFARINWELYEAVQKLMPFGMGNPEPVFASKNVEVVGCKGVGKDKKHLKLRLKDEYKYLDAIAFNFGDFFDRINPTDKIDIAYKIKPDDWNGNNRLQLDIRDVIFP